MIWQALRVIHAIRRMVSGKRSARPYIWDDDPVFSVEDWQYEVANGYTRVGYWEWVGHQREAAADPPVDTVRSVLCVQDNTRVRHEQ